MCLCTVPEIRIEGAETAVAVRLERTHPQLFGTGKGLAVVVGGGLDLGGRLARRALAQEPQRPGLVAALLVLAGEVECLRREGCHEGQGFLFSRARPNSEIVGLLKTQGNWSSPAGAALVA